MATRALTAVQKNEFVWRGDRASCARRSVFSIDTNRRVGRARLRSLS